MSEPVSLPPREDALDALRGLAILGMVLSGSLAFGEALPAWMFHAQVPPPLHKFVPTRAGITWVDLVFPFFLFAMGAALPLAMQKLRTEGVALLNIARRFGLLLFLALFSQHVKGTEGALAGFIALGLTLGPGPRMLKLLGWGLALGMVIAPLRPEGFSLGRSDIILLVLADMALFGGLLFWATRSKPWVRVAALPLLAAVLLGRDLSGSWTAALAAATPAAWAYKLYYLKYLFILVPGMFVGEWLQARREHGEAAAVPALDALLMLGLVALNVTLLYARETTLCLLLTVPGLALLYWRALALDVTSARIVRLGAYLLLLGLALEPLEGGIHKDSSTFSYYAVGAGLACLTLLALQGGSAHINRWLALHGRNPLLAYVAGSLCITPLLQLSGLYDSWSQLNDGWAQGLFKGLLYTGAVSVLTCLASLKGWRWKS